MPYLEQSSYLSKNMRFTALQIKKVVCGRGSYHSKIVGSGCIRDKKYPIGVPTVQPCLTKASELPMYNVIDGLN